MFPHHVLTGADFTGLTGLDTTGKSKVWVMMATVSFIMPTVNNDGLPGSNSVYLTLRIEERFEGLGE
jgi:hypothetical protein